MPKLSLPSLTFPRTHLGAGVAALVAVAVAPIIFRASTTPALAFTQPAPDPVGAVAGALQVAVMIEGDGVYGAGILIDPQKGLVLTNQHVVQDMHTPKLSAYDGRTAQGVVLSVDKARDLALITAPGLVTPGLAAPRIGDVTRLRPGEEVYAVGMPRKLPFTVSRGIVSFVNRPMDGASWLQLDMNINDGNSGGPVVSSSGEIVGIMSFIYRRASGLSFALPMTEIAAAFPAAVPVIPPKL